MNYKTEAKKFWAENAVIGASSIEGREDTEFGTCEATGRKGTLVCLSFITEDGGLFEAELLEPIAYEIHGLAGAY